MSAMLTLAAVAVLTSLLTGFNLLQRFTLHRVKSTKQTKNLFFGICLLSGLVVVVSGGISSLAPRPVTAAAVGLGVSSSYWIAEDEAKRGGASRRGSDAQGLSKLLQLIVKYALLGGKGLTDNLDARLSKLRGDKCRQIKLDIERLYAEHVTLMNPDKVYPCYEEVAALLKRWKEGLKDGALRTKCLKEIEVATESAKDDGGNIIRLVTLAYDWGMEEDLLAEAATPPPPHKLRRQIEPPTPTPPFGISVSQ